LDRRRVCRAGRIADRPGPVRAVLSWRHGEHGRCMPGAASLQCPAFRLPDRSLSDGHADLRGLPGARTVRPGRTKPTARRGLTLWPHGDKNLDAEVPNLKSFQSDAPNFGLFEDHLQGLGRQSLIRTSNPVFAAKQMVTVDHVGRGRFGLNIVLV